MALVQRVRGRVGELLAVFLGEVDDVQEPDVRGAHEDRVPRAAGHFFYVKRLYTLIVNDSFCHNKFVTIRVPLACCGWSELLAIAHLAAYNRG